MKTKKLRYIVVILVLMWVLFVFQFSCVTEISRFSPGDAIISILSLSDSSRHLEVISRVDDINLDEIDPSQANKLAYLAALSAMQVDEWDTAERYLEYCLSRYGILEDYVLFYLSDVYSKQGNFEGALASGRRLLEEHPDSIWFDEMTLTLADYHAGMGEYDTAREIYDDFLDHNTSSDLYPDVLFKKGLLLEMSGERNEAIEIYRTIFIDYAGDDTAADAFAGLVRLGGVGDLSAKDLRNRIDTLYNADYYTSCIGAIKEMAALLDTTEADLPGAGEISFIKAKCYYGAHKYESAAALFERLAKDNPGIPEDTLLYWRAKAQDKMENDDAAISLFIELFEKNPKGPLADDSLYLAARTCEEIGDFDRALKYYKKYLTTYSHSKRIEDVTWYIAWIYYQEAQYELALEYFENLAARYRKKDGYPQYIYWRARSMEELFRYEEAYAVYRTLVEDYPYTYYSYQAKERLEKMGYTVTITPREEEFDPNFWTAGFDRSVEFTSDERITSHLAKALDLIAMNRDEEAAGELSLVMERSTGDPELLIEVARLLRFSGDYYTPVLIVNRSFPHHLDEYIPGENDLYWQMKYPKAYEDEVLLLSAEFDMEPALIYSVMRAESLFQPRVYSWAGAVGLMQIMPATGEEIAANMGLEDFEKEDLLDHRTNLRFGVFYLSGLMDDFDGEVVYALCGYNGGPGNARKWKRTADPEMEMDEIIENIPFSETRAYVKRILGYYRIYKTLYEGESRIQ
ncbi:MAG: tetratricopeptide repeat protein [Deltaproteobacteria bacterium]|nr:tetratricopeptide repeat protein [Candidatus Zymogenaceae bacterium]